MLLAGNGSFSTQQPKVQVQVDSPKQAAVDVTPVNQSLIAPCSQLLSPISISSDTSSYSVSGSIAPEENVPAKAVMAPPTPSTNLEPEKPNIMPSGMAIVRVGLCYCLYDTLLHSILLYF